MSWHRGQRWNNWEDKSQKVAKGRRGDQQRKGGGDKPSSGMSLPSYDKVQSSASASSTGGGDHMDQVLSLLRQVANILERLVLVLHGNILAI